MRFFLFQAEGDEANNTSVEEAPQDPEATENKEEVEEKVNNCKSVIKELIFKNSNLKKLCIS